MFSDLAEILYYVCSQQGRTYFWKHIYFKFEPNLKTFYYIQKYEPFYEKRKGLLEYVGAIVHLRALTGMLNYSQPLKYSIVNPRKLGFSLKYLNFRVFTTVNS